MVAVIPKVPPEKRGVSIPRWASQPRAQEWGRGAQTHLTMKVNRDSVHQGELENCTRDIGTLLKGQCGNLIYSHLSLAMVEERWSGLESCEEKLGFVAVGTELKRQLPGFLS